MKKKADHFTFAMAVVGMKELTYKACLEQLQDE